MAGRGRIYQLRDAQPPHLVSRPHVIRVLDDPQLHRRLPPPRSILPSITALEDLLADQHREINALLGDNQHLSATHVALQQELDASRNELRVASAASARARAERESELREVIDRSSKVEAEARAVEDMRMELVQVRSDVQRLGESRSEVLDRLQGLQSEVSRAREELGQASAVRAEIDTMSREIQRGRAAVEYEKKARAENMLQSQDMEKNMISMAREVEKLRVELADAEKRARASAAAALSANPSLGYPDAYRNAGMAFGGSTYPLAYNLNQVPHGADAVTQYGPTGYDSMMHQLR